MVPLEIIILKEHLPPSLSARQALGFLKIGQVFVVREDSDRVGGAHEVLAPFSECMYDHKKLSVIYVVVSLSWGKCFREVCAGVKVSIGVFLHEHAARGS